MKLCFIIPARLDSERFPNKLTTEFLGKPIIEHVISLGVSLKNTLSTNHEVDVILAVDFISTPEFIKIHQLVNDYNIDIFILNDRYPTSCGSEKVKWVARETRKNYDYYITLPADEPAMDVDSIGRSITNIVDRKEKNTVYTLYTDFYCEDDITDTRSCKIVTDYANAILYTSRSPIPGKKDGTLHSIDKYKKHLGVFVFPKKVVKNDIWEPQNNSQLESLEQNIYINRDFKFKAEQTKHIGFGIDTPDQIDKLEKRIKQ